LARFSGLLIFIVPREQANNFACVET